VKRVAYDFSLHGFLTMRIRDTIGVWDRLLMRPMRGYVHHRVEGLPAPADIEVRIGPFEFADVPCRRIDRRFDVAGDYFACRDTYKILSWQVEISGWEKPPTLLNIDRNAFGTAAIGSRIIDCMVRYHLNRKGCPAVHACGLTGKAGAYLLSGRSGVGKSTLAMRLLERGFRLLGDNWIILRDGLAHSLHLPVNVHDYNVPAGFRARMPRRLRWDMRLKALARKLSGGYFKKSTPLILAQVFPNLVAERAPLRRIYTFSQGQEFHVAPMDRASGLARLLANDMMDREAFARYMLAYSAVFPDGPVAGHWQRLRENLSAAVGPEVEFLDVVVPRRLTPAIVDRLAGAME
jgi:hypothetical protein